MVKRNEKKDLRDFGLFLATLLGVIGAVSFYKQGSAWPVLWGVAAYALLAGLFVKPLLRPVQQRLRFVCLGLFFSQVGEGMQNDMCIIPFPGQPLGVFYQLGFRRTACFHVPGLYMDKRHHSILVLGRFCFRSIGKRFHGRRPVKTITVPE